LDKQETGGLFDFSIVIVDNDVLESARRTVELRARASKIFIRYYVEPEQNIALARNKAIGNSEGDFVAFIDDDEFPEEQWLATLYKMIQHYRSDGILSPVLPHFEEKPPQWVLRGHFFDRPSHPTGHVLVWKNTRTGNALLKHDLFKDGTKWFDPAFGSGGEDRDFFRRKIEQGYVFVWCNEAPVFETVPPKRWKRTVLLKRALLRGKMALNMKEPRFMSLFNSAAAVAIYSCCLPVLLFLGHHVFMKYLIKDCDHLGKILASLGIDWVGEKYVG
jgi:glycosyltransferase involved in cell wall biosynthesis